jgi:hypothetical protein
MAVVHIYKLASVVTTFVENIERRVSCLRLCN